VKIFMAKKNQWALADKLQGSKPTKYMKNLRKQSEAEDKKRDKEHKQYLKERAARYKREGISE
jgi:hypothetical protein